MATTSLTPHPLGAPGSAGISPRRIGRYAIYQEIAKGGMATVYYGRLIGPVGFGRTVAIKQLHPQFASDPEFVDGFVDEARLAARIQHPNVVQTLDVVTSDGEVVLVMDYVHGESLARLITAARQRDTRIPLKIAATIAVNVLWGLHAAHEAKSEHGEPLQLVHRDMSPQNVLVGADGVARVLDFGIAKAETKAQENTREGVIKGKLSYMAPEQIRDAANVDRRVDVYATSVLLWEMIALQKLFRADDQFELLAMVRDNRVRKPSEVVGTVPADLEAIVMKGLSGDPEDRYATAKEMAIALEHSVPQATPREVGDWVAGLAREVLGDRRARVDEIEISSARLQASESGQSLAAPIPLITPMPTHQLLASSSGSISPAAVGGTNPTMNSAIIEPERRRGPAVMMLAVMIVLLGGLGGAVLAMRGSSGSARGPEVVEGRSRPAAAREQSSGEATTTTSTAAPVGASASAGAAVSEPALVASAEIPREKKRAPGALTKSSSSAKADTEAPKAPATGVAVAPSPASCSPPYTVDDQGIKHPKPECL